MEAVLYQSSLNEHKYAHLFTEADRVGNWASDPEDMIAFCLNKDKLSLFFGDVDEVTAAGVNLSFYYEVEVFSKD